MKPPILAVFGNALITIANGQTSCRVLPDGADISAEIIKTVGDLSPSPASLDLVYHPHELVCVVAECANLSRKKLQKYFAGEHRELTNAATCWAVTKPQPHVDGKFTSILHFEPRPRLDHVLHLIEENFGTRGRVAVPPAAVLANRTKSEHLELAVLVAGTDYLFYHVNENGKPSVRLLRSFQPMAELLGVALSSRLSPPKSALVVCDGASAPPELSEFLTSHAITVQACPWESFLAADDFKPSDSANLAQRPFKWAKKHSMGLAAALLITAAAGMGYNYGVASYRAYQNERHIEARRATLASEVKRLSVSRDAYMVSKSIVDAVPTANPRPSAFLDALTQAMPPALQLQAYRYRDGQFSLDGIAYEGIGQEKGPLASFVDSLAAGSADRPWEFKSPKTALASANWTLVGHLKP